MNDINFSNQNQYSYKIIIDNKEVTITRTYSKEGLSLLESLVKYIKNNKDL